MANGPTTHELGRPLEILFPNGQVEGVQVFIWDDHTLQPILWDGHITGFDTAERVNQGTPTTDDQAWPVKLVEGGQEISPTNPLDVQVKQPVAVIFETYQALQGRAVSIPTSASGFQVLVPADIADPTALVSIFRMALIFSGSGQAGFSVDGASIIFGPFDTTPGTTITLDLTDRAWFVTGSGIPFSIWVSGGVGVVGQIYYVYD